MLSHILLNILSPILLMILLGALLRRKFAIDLGTLSKLNIYLVVPAFIFDKVSTSTLSWSEMGGVVIITVTQVFTLGAVVWGIGRLLRVPPKTLAAIALAVMFYNSANYGLPLAELAFPRSGQFAAPGRDGGAVQAFVVMTQNILTFTVGLSIAAWAGTGSFLQGLKTIARLPMLPTLAAALAAKAYLNADPSHHLPIALSKTAGYLSAALVPIALVTLGAQLARNPRWPRWKPVSMVLVLRLIFGPIQMAGMLYLFHKIGWAPLDLWPWPADLLILTAAVPTAVNTLLLTLELNGDADLAADCVFWTTVFSAVTITIWLLIIGPA